MSGYVTNPKTGVTAYQQDNGDTVAKDSVFDKNSKNYNAYIDKNGGNGQTQHEDGSITGAYNGGGGGSSYQATPQQMADYQGGGYTNGASYGGGYDATANLNSLKEFQKQAAAADLGKARDNSLSNLSQDREKIAPQYYNNREKTSTASQLGAKTLAEYMASRGQTSAGASMQGEINRVSDLKGDIGDWDTQEQGAFNDNTRSVTNTNNAYEKDIASSNAGIEAEGMKQLIALQAQQRAEQLAQANADRSYNYQVGRDTVGDNRYNTEYKDQRGDVAYGRYYQSGRDNINDTGMINGQFTQQGKLNDTNQQMQTAQLEEMRNPNSTTNQMAKLGLQTAELNYAALPAQLKSQAQLIAQQLSKGAIDIKTAQVQLDYLPRQMQADLNAKNASAAAAGRSNRGGGSGGGMTATQQRAASAKETKNAAYAQFNKAMSAGNGSQWLISNADNIIGGIGEDVYYDMEKRVSTDKNFVMEVMKDKARKINSSPAY